MATITLDYNARSSKARAAINGILATGMFTARPVPKRKSGSDQTLEAIAEAKAGKHAGVVDTSSVEAMTRSILGI